MSRTDVILAAMLENQQYYKRQDLHVICRFKKKGLCIQDTQTVHNSDGCKLNGITFWSVQTARI